MNLKKMLVAASILIMITTMITQAFANDKLERYGRCRIAEMDDSDKLLWAYDTIKDGIELFRKTIYLKNDVYHLTKAEIDFVTALNDRDYPEHSYVDYKGGTYVFDDNNKYVESFAPLYIMNEDSVGAGMNNFVDLKENINWLLEEQRESVNDDENIKLMYEDVGLLDDFMKYVENGTITESLIAHNIIALIAPGVTMLNSETGNSCIYNESFEYLNATGFSKLVQYMLNQYNIEAFLVEDESGADRRTFVAANLDGQYKYINPCLSYEEMSKTEVEKDGTLEMLIDAPMTQEFEDSYVAEQNAQTKKYIKYAIIGVGVFGALVLFSTIGNKKKGTKK